MPRFAPVEPRTLPLLLVPWVLDLARRPDRPHVRGREVTGQLASKKDTLNPLATFLDLSQEGTRKRCWHELMSRARIDLSRSKSG